METPSTSSMKRVVCTGFAVRADFPSRNSSSIAMVPKGGLETLRPLYLWLRGYYFFHSVPVKSMYVSPPVFDDPRRSPLQVPFPPIRSNLPVPPVYSYVPSNTLFFPPSTGVAVPINLTNFVEPSEWLYTRFAVNVPLPST